MPIPIWLIPILKGAMVPAAAGAGIQYARGKRGDDLWKGALAGMAMAAGGAVAFGPALGGVGAAGAAGAGAAGAGATAAGAAGATGAAAAGTAAAGTAASQAALATSNPGMWAKMMAATKSFAADAAKEGTKQAVVGTGLQAMQPQVTTTSPMMGTEIPPMAPLQFAQLDFNQRKKLGLI